MASWRFLFLVAYLSASAIAQSINYVTDIGIYTSMARCAQSAVSYNVMSMTYSSCGEAVSELQSCICTKNGGANSAAVSKAISSSISYSCGSTASDDYSSAMVLFNGYCDQAHIGTFPTPTNKINAYITDLPALQDLAPCAASGVSLAVMSMTYDLCPDDPTLLQSCVCSKNQNSLRVSQLINSSVKYSCSPITADITQAQGVFAGYCGLGAGVTSFPVASAPPGDMTYYVTALPQYSSLAPCAQYGVSYGILAQTADLCPKDPAGLASCVCLKSGMQNLVSKTITSSVKYSCDSTATDDVNSALSVWDYFCSAVKAEVKPSVTESISTSAHSGSVGNFVGPAQTGKPSGSSSGTGSNGSSTSADGTSGEKRPNIGLIVGGVIGGLAVIIIIGVAVFFVMRRRNAGNSSQVNIAMAPTNGPNMHSGGKTELDGTAVAVRPGTAHSQNLSPHHTGPNGGGSISPMSAQHTGDLKVNGPYAPPPQMPEMPAQYHYPPRPGQPPHQELHGQDQRPELYGQQVFRPELAGHGVSQPYHAHSNSHNSQSVYSAAAMVSPQSPLAAGGWNSQGGHVHEAPVTYQNQVPQRSELHGQQWGGPAPTQYYEMPGGGTGYAR